MTQILNLVQKPNETETETEGDEHFLTKADVKRMLDEEKRTENQKKTEYESGYMQKVFELGLNAAGEEDPDHEAICEILSQKEFNIKHSDNPALDAELNYRNASTAFYKKKAAAGKDKENPLKGRKEGGPPLGADSQSDKATEKTIQLPELDEHAKDFIKSTGMKEESIEKALSGPAKSYHARG